MRWFDYGKPVMKIAGESGSKRPRIAVGGFDVDLQDIDGKGSARTKKSAAPEKFRGFDAEKKLRHAGKPGHKAFKSKKRSVRPEICAKVTHRIRYAADTREGESYKQRIQNPK